MDIDYNFSVVGVFDYYIITVDKKKLERERALRVGLRFRVKNKNKNRNSESRVKRQT